MVTRGDHLDPEDVVFGRHVRKTHQTAFYQAVPLHAIEMEQMPESLKMKARVMEAECMGCGVCVLQCKQQALTFELVRSPEHIPPKPANVTTGMGPRPR